MVVVVVVVVAEQEKEGPPLPVKNLSDTLAAFQGAVIALPLALFGKRGLPESRCRQSLPENARSNDQCPLHVSKQQFFLLSSLHTVHINVFIQVFINPSLPHHFTHLTP